MQQYPLTSAGSGREEACRRSAAFQLSACVGAVKVDGDDVEAFVGLRTDKGDARGSTREPAVGVLVERGKVTDALSALDVRPRADPQPSFAVPVASTLELSLVAVHERTSEADSRR
jgi:hypothetical protein